MDLSTLTMTEIIRLQNQLSAELARRFERPMALAFTDIVGSTPYFRRFGDEAGRKLQQRHLDLVLSAVTRWRGRIVDTAGDGAFLCFPHVDDALHAMVQLQAETAQANFATARDHQLNLRIGIHHGSVLTDGLAVTGDAVNLCARVAASAAEGEVRLTRAAASEISDLVRRLSCAPIGPVVLKGLDRPVDLLSFDWRDPAKFPSRVKIVETGAEIALPNKDFLSFVRLADAEGVVANDVVLSLPDPNQTKQISRWHFELRRGPDGYVFRCVTEQATMVDGATLSKGMEVPVRPGSKVRLGLAMTLLFESRAPTGPVGDATFAVPR